MMFPVQTVRTVRTRWARSTIVVGLAGLVLVVAAAGCGGPETAESVGAGVSPIESNEGAVLVKPPDVLEAGPDADAEADARARDQVADVAFTWFDGTAGSLAELWGTPTVLNFWASSCPPCVAEMPDFEAVHQDLGDRVAFVGMNVADRHEAAVALAERTGVTYRLAKDPDSEVFRSFNGFVMPTTILIDADGRVAYAWAGVLTESELRTLIAENLLDSSEQQGASS